MSAPRSSSPSESAPEFSDVAAEALIPVGFVFRPHGMSGELKVNPDALDDPTRFEGLEEVYIGRVPHQVTRHTISSLRYQETKRGTTVILGLSDVESRSDAETVTKLRVFAVEEDLDLADDGVAIEDLVGLDVVSEEGEHLGTVANYMEMPAQDVFVVRRPNQSEAMIPAIEPFIVSVDLEGGRLVVRPVDGLFA